MFRCRALQQDRVPYVCPHDSSPSEGGQEHHRRPRALRMEQGRRGSRRTSSNVQGHQGRLRGKRLNDLQKDKHI